MKEIQLSKTGKHSGKYVAFVDDEDFEYLNQFKWWATKNKNTCYARTCFKGKTIGMHRLIMNTPNYLQVDHIDHNGYNNQKSNLRNCKQTENTLNRISVGKSKYLGITPLIRKYKNRTYNYFQVYIQIDYIPYYVGCYKNEIDAALKYNRLAKRFHGRYSNLNTF